MAAKKPKRATPTEQQEQPISAGGAAAHLAATITAAGPQSRADDEDAEKMFFRIPRNVVRAIEKLAEQANRSRNFMAVQLLIVGLDGVLAALPEDKRDEVLLHTMTTEE